MTNIRLFLDNNEIELSETSVIAITKQFEEISNPTVICNDWSKTIDVPFTANNNKIFGLLYHPDRVIVDDEDILTHLNFDPFKKIPFRLEYENSIIMTGYAKNIYSTQSNGVGYYSITLNGELGKIFQEMQRITFDPATEDATYLIDTSEYVYTEMNKELIYNSWNSDGQQKMTLYKRTDANYDINDIIGFMPNNSFDTASNFDYKNFQKDYYSIMKFTDVLEDAKFEAAAGMTPDTAIPNGVTPRGLGEYRSYLQIPYIYFNKLFKLLMAKTTEITGYNFVLGGDWFVDSNPLWKDLCVVLNPLDTTKESVISAFDYNVDKDNINGLKITKSDSPYCIGLYEMLKGRTNIKTDSSLLNIRRISYNLNWMMDYSEQDYVNQSTRIPTISFQIYGAKDDINYGVVAFVAIADNTDSSLYSNLPSGTHITQTYGSADATKRDFNMWKWQDNLLSGGGGGYLINVADEFDVDFTVTQAASDANDGEFYICARLGWFNLVSNIGTIPPYEGKESGDPVYFNADGYFRQDSNFTVQTNGAGNKTVKSRSFSYFNLSNLWDNDYTPFDIVLNYTKLCRLIWEVDEVNKKIIITPAHSYFEDYTIKDWTNKLDMTQTFEVKPISFEHKYVTFNYDDNEGQLYKEYKNLYGINYGDMKLITDYNFNTETQELFDDLQTAIINTDNTLSWSTLYNDKDIYYSLPAETSLYCQDKDGKFKSCFGAFLFRDGKRKFDTSENLNMRSVKISDDTFYQRYTDTYCYSQSQSQLATDYYSNMTLVKDGKCCLVNIPMKNYTYNSDYFKDAVSIYDLLWADYLGERYDKNNKIITCYLRLSQFDFANFKFSDFIKINNQIYIVNKIYDYNPASEEGTKVELINIQNIDGYTKDNYTK